MVCHCGRLAVTRCDYRVMRTEGPGPCQQPLCEEHRHPMSACTGVDWCERHFQHSATTVLRVRYRTLGGHVHCRVFTAATRTGTFTNCGTLVFTVDEFPTVMTLMRGAEFLPDTEWR